MKYIEPFNTYFDMESFKLVPEGERIVRRLSDMADMYQDQEAVQEKLKEDPVIYEFTTVEVPEDAGNLLHCISIVYPGKIGNEYYMTKGHFHEEIDTAEIYFTVKGQGQLVMETPDGDTSVIEMKEGMISYIPPYWAHRTVNTGDEPFVFFGVYRADAGHNYGTIEEKGMAKLVMERNGQLSIEDNPNY
jgi:glucose-6-phosphate isomerase